MRKPIKKIKPFHRIQISIGLRGHAKWLCIPILWQFDAARHESIVDKRLTSLSQMSMQPLIKSQNKLSNFKFSTNCRKTTFHSHMRPGFNVRTIQNHQHFDGFDLKANWISTMHKILIRNLVIYSFAFAGVLHDSHNLWTSWKHLCRTTPVTMCD